MCGIYSWTFDSTSSMSLNPDFYTVNNSCIAPLVAASFLSLYLIVQRQNQNYLYSKYSQIILNLLYKMVTLMYYCIRIKLSNTYFQEFSCLLNSNKYQKMYLCCYGAESLYRPASGECITSSDRRCSTGPSTRPSSRYMRFGSATSSPGDTSIIGQGVFQIKNSCNS